MKVQVYTDGGCTHNGKKDARASYAYYFPDHPSLSHADRVPDDHPQTNNRGELLAIQSCVNKAAESFDASDVDLYIYTDSEYSKNCLTKWIPGWIRNNWKTTSGTVVLNRDLIEAVAGKLVEFKSYCIIHVKAHTGGDDEFSKNNHIVDRMAAEALEGPKPPPVKVVAKDVDGCPLQLMGPPVSDTTLGKWCRANIDKLDADALDIALIAAFSKTAKKNGCDLVKQKLHRTTQYRIVASSHIITEVHKQEE
jgi:ribonuclease HI